MAGDRSVPSVDTGHHDHWAAHCLYSHSGPLVGYVDVESPSYIQCSTLMSDTSHERKQIKHFWLVLDLNVGALQVSFENDPILNQTFANSFNQAFPPPSRICKKYSYQVNTAQVMKRTL